VSEPIIVAEDVRVQYGAGVAGVLALDGVSLEVQRGEVMLIVGPSGSGKTTLLQVLGALIQPTSGNVVIGGRNTDALSIKELRRLRLDSFGFVFQLHRLIPTLTAWENVALALDLKGVRGRAAEQRSRELLEELGLSNRADAYPGQMSGGQRQRVAIARACALDPPVILADEPTASLDSTSARQVTQLFCELAERHGRAVVIVTHDTRLMSSADRTVIIEDGRINAASHTPLLPPEASAGARWEN
jgi:putative ABC transport system ATP-binding protein